MIMHALIHFYVLVVTVTGPLKHLILKYCNPYYNCTYVLNVFIYFLNVCLAYAVVTYCTYLLTCLLIYHCILRPLAPVASGPPV